jgi:methionine-rich copper-binding protein CopC
VRRFLLLLLLLPLPAVAHSELRGSEPVDGAHLATPPAALILRFNEPVQVTALRLLDASGTSVALRRSAETRPAAIARAEPAATLPSGSWRLEWRAISADGHPIRGVLRFTVMPP